MNDYFHCNANSETCGWIAAVLAMICFGSFGVPIKGDAAKSVDIDPLVMQSYKTFMCFVASFFVLPLGVKFTFSPWGIVSGLFWVPSGVLAIYAIRNAGLALSFVFVVVCCFQTLILIRVKIPYFLNTNAKH
mmetsp:Transcript_13667/g.17340  ORF Transcript_13667/g.17340 Transcript_13667/m.17340 type:complete len:132 (-) Transcript_13667:2-397(-)